MPKISKFKVVLVGDQNVGKTSVISRLIHDSFDPSLNPTIGIDFVTKTLLIGEETLRLQLWDTAGQQRFRSLIPSYVRDADACLVVIDLSSRQTLEGVNKWLDFIRESRGDDAVIFLVGNKLDVEERQISSAEIQQYSQKQKYPLVEVSAKQGTNITTLFHKVGQTLIQNKTNNSPRKQLDSSNNKGKELISRNDAYKNFSLSSINIDEGKRECEC